MTTPRQRRIADAIQLELSQLLLIEANDPRLDGVTVTEVAIDRELQYADVYVNALGDEERRDEVLGALERATGFIRHRLSKSLDLRKVPELRFEWDTAFEHAARIDELLDSLDIPDDSGGDGRSD
jgi:ribosome-binding factor A